MAKYANDAFMDAALSWIKTNCDALYVCSTQPTTYTEASSTYKLGASTSYTVTGSPASDASPAGRQITIQAASSVAITSAGTMAHIALTGSIASTQTLMYVTTIPSGSQVSVAASDKVNMAAWTVTVADVTP